MSEAIDGSGAILTYAGSEIGEVLSAKWSGLEREAVNTTPLKETEAHTFRGAKLYDAGEVTVTLNVKDTSIASLITGYTEPQPLALSFGDQGSLSAQAIPTSIDPVELNGGENVGSSVTFKLSGTI